MICPTSFYATRGVWDFFVSSHKTQTLPNEGEGRLSLNLCQGLEAVFQFVGNDAE